MYIPLTFEGALQKCLFASGGYEGYFISGSQEYKFHWFTSSANLVVDKGTIDNVSITVVGAGGGGGTGNVYQGGGGAGGGGVTTTIERLYKGTYTAVVGAPGIGGGAVTNNPGTNGEASSFSGANISLSAGGGQRGGVYPDWFGSAGGPGGGNGGKGNGPTGNPPRSGDIGTTIYFDNSTFCLGAGGGGANCAGCTPGYFPGGCQGAGDAPGGDGTDGWGGGGAGGTSPGYSIGGRGGSGSVFIQYPIYDYCSNYFNETGSCDCREITFDITDPLNYYPQYTGSYQYTQCGTNTLISGSLKPYFPKTVCAASGSWYWVQGNSGYGNYSGPVNSTYPECLSASYGVETCVTQSFPPTCNSNIYTFSNSGSGASTIYWVPKNSGNFSYSNLGAGAVTYQCVSNGSIGSIGSYPYGGSTRVYTTASCSNTTFTATWNGVGPTVAFAAMKYMQCNGTITELVLERGATSGTTVRSASVCADRTVTPTTRYGGGFPIPSTVVSYGTSCLGNYIDTGSCGCP